MNKKTKRKLIAVIDDEVDIVELVSVNLEKNGFKVKGFYKADDMFKYFKTTLPDLIILDLMLPDNDGFDICKTLNKDNKTADIPIIMLTAKTEEMDKILGLELGADDYITKPFSPREMVARVKAVLRRFDKKEKKTNIINIKNTIKVDLQKHKVFVKEKEIVLTATEFNILIILAEHKGWVLSRDQILDHLWGDEKIVVDRTVDVHVRHLREKMGDASQYIKNIRGVGYKLEE